MVKTKCRDCLPPCDCMCLYQWSNILSEWELTRSSTQESDEAHTQSSLPSCGCHDHWLLTGNDGTNTRLADVITVRLFAMEAAGVYTHTIIMCYCSLLNFLHQMRFVAEVCVHTSYIVLETCLMIISCSQNNTSRL